MAVVAWSVVAVVSVVPLRPVRVSVPAAVPVTVVFVLVVVMYGDVRVGCGSGSGQVSWLGSPGRVVPLPSGRDVWVPWGRLVAVRGG